MIVGDGVLVGALPGDTMKTGRRMTDVGARLSEVTDVVSWKLERLISGVALDPLSLSDVTSCCTTAHTVVPPDGIGSVALPKKLKSGKLGVQQRRLLWFCLNGIETGQRERRGAEAIDRCPGLVIANAPTNWTHLGKVDPLVAGLPGACARLAGAALACVIMHGRRANSARQCVCRCSLTR